MMLAGAARRARRHTGAARPPAAPRRRRSRWRWRTCTSRRPSRPGLTGDDLEGASFYELLAQRFGTPVVSGTQTVGAGAGPATRRPSCSASSRARRRSCFERTSRRRATGGSRSSSGRSTAATATGSWSTSSRRPGAVDATSAETRQIGPTVLDLWSHTRRWSDVLMRARLGCRPGRGRARRGVLRW